jgi:hypothetical protein
MTAWNGPDLAETPFDLRLLDWLRDHPDRTAHQIAVSLGLTDPHNRQAQQVVEKALKRLKLRSLVRDEDKLSPSRLIARYWSTV